MSDIPRHPAPEDEASLGPDEDPEGAENTEDTGTEADQAGDGGEADEDADGAEPEEEELLADEPPPRRGGGSQAIRAQRARAQAAERELAEERRQRQEDRQRLQALEQRIAQDPQAQARAEAEWQERLEMMTPAQAAQAVMQRGRQEFGQALQAVQFQANDRADKAAYDAEARVNPIHRKYRAEVERVLAEERRVGRNPDREVILDVLYGREMRLAGTRAAPGQRRAAAARVAAAQTRPTGARSTANPGSRRPAPGSREDDERIIAEGIARGERVF